MARAGGLLVSALLVMGGCGRSIVHLARKGKFDAAIAEAESRRREPEGRAARAYAEALSERSRHEDARSVLLRDFRHGGDVRSLVALADLERSLHLHGIAASHYGRAADLDRASLLGREDVCALLRRRAQVWVGEGAGLAAERDLARADDLCGAPADEAERARLGQLLAAVDRAAQVEVDARVALGECDADCESSLDRSAEWLAAARAEGPAALRRYAAHARVEVSPEDVVLILSADLRGEAGEALLRDDEVRQLVGEQRWSTLAPAVMSQDPQIASYLQLRLASVVSDVPVTLRSRTGPGELDLWLAHSLEATDEHAWRMLGWAGDLTAAELALSTRWRPKRAASTASAASGEPSSGPPSGESPSAQTSPASAHPQVVGTVEPAEHWTSRVALTSRSLGPLLLEGRLRHLAGQESTALSIHRYVAARAIAADVEHADRAVAREAGWHLAHGRPWHALAVASVVSRPHCERAAAAAATAVRLQDAFCGGPCRSDRDRRVVERTLGEDWVAQREGMLVDRSRRRSRPATPLDACPTLGELLAPGAEGRLADALAGARGDRAAVGQGKRLREAIEADVGLGCAGRFVLPLMREGGHTASAGALAQLLSHDAVLDAPRALTVHAALAMIAGHEQQASLLATAAGAVSREPVRTWRDLAEHAHASGHRELALRSLREALLHTPGLDDPTLHRAMVLAGLHGIATDWNLRQAPAGQREPASHVADLLARVPGPRRFAAREDLARALAEQPWMDADARQRLAPALWPDEASEQAHAIGRAWIGLASGRPPALLPVDVGPLDLASQELLVVMRKQSALAPATAAFVDPSHMESLRLSLAGHSREWTRRWRTAIGLVVWGSPAYRARAAATLLSMAEPDQRRALVDVLLEGPAVVEPSRQGPMEAAPLASAEDELRVVFSLPFSGLGL